MKRLGLFLVALGLFAQTPGTVLVALNVTAKAGAITCVFSNAAKPTIHTVCTAGTSNLTQDSTSAVGSTSGAVGSFQVAGDSVTWVIQQPTAGNVTWQIAANGTMQSGNF